MPSAASSPENKMKMVMIGGPIAKAASPSLARHPMSIPIADAVNASIVRTPRKFKNLAGVPKKYGELKRNHYCTVVSANVRIYEC